MISLHVNDKRNEQQSIWKNEKGGIALKIEIFYKISK